MRKPWLPAFAGLVLVWGIAACSRQEHSGNASMASAEAAADADAELGRAPAKGGGSAAAPQARMREGFDSEQLVSSAASVVDSQRRFIRTARAQFEVDDVYRAALAIEDEVAAQQGFVTDNSIGAQVRGVERHAMGGGKLMELTEYVLEGEMTVRVPSERTQAFLRALAPHIRFLDVRSFNARDAQFELLRQQLAWQRAQEAQQEIGQVAEGPAKAGTRLDAVQARAQARGSRDEALLAQREFEDRVAYSTITLALRQAPQIRSAQRVDVESVLRERRPGFFRRLGESMRAGWQGVLDCVVALSAVWPLWLVLAVGGWSLWRWRRRRAAAARAG